MTGFEQVAQLRAHNGMTSKVSWKKSPADQKIGGGTL